MKAKKKEQKAEGFLKKADNHQNEKRLRVERRFSMNTSARSCLKREGLC